MKLPITVAAEILLAGGVVAYPTEGVFGLGCMPDDASAIIRLLRIKRRDPSKGLILIASRHEQLADWIAMDRRPCPTRTRRSRLRGSPRLTNGCPAWSGVGTPVSRCA